MRPSNSLPLAEVTHELESGSRPKGGISEKDFAILSIGGEHIGADGRIDLENGKFVSASFYSGMRRGRLRRHDILIVKDGATTGKVALVDDSVPLPSSINEHVFRLSLNQNAFPKYVFYYLLSPAGKQDILKDFRGATVGGISQDFIHNVIIPLPSLEAQKRTAEILGKAERLALTRKDTLVLSDKFLPAAFLELFGSLSEAAKRFPSSELGNVAAFVDYRGISPNKSPSGVRLITARNVKRGYFDIEPQEFIPEEEYVSWMRRGIPLPGDVLFTTEGHTLGSAAKLPAFEKIALAQRLIALQPKEQIRSDYLLHLILHPSFQRQVVKYSTGSAARGISSKNLAELPIPVPPLALQQRFASLAERVQQMRSVQQESLRQAEHLFQTLLHSAFVGEPMEFDHA